MSSDFAGESANQPSVSSTNAFERPPTSAVAAPNQPVIGPIDDESFDTALLAHLAGLLTPNRRRRFSAVMAQRTRKLAVVCENLSQAHNFSAVLRSCDCFGVQDVYVLDPRQVFDVSKDVALGAEKWLTLHRFETPTATPDGVAALKAKGYRIVATSPHGQSVPIHELPVDEPTALVMGTELHGISPELEELADARTHIPMHGFTESFNVSVAAAICLAELTRRLRATTTDWALTELEQRELTLTWARRSIKSIDSIEARFHAEREQAKGRPNDSV